MLYKPPMNGAEISPRLWCCELAWQHNPVLRGSGPVFLLALIMELITTTGQTKAFVQDARGQPSTGPYEAVITRDLLQFQP